jgi:hypothetical protein
MERNTNETEQNRPIAVSSTAQAVTYTYHALPLIDGNPTTKGGAYGVNDSGVAVG